MKKHLCLILVILLIVCSLTSCKQIDLATEIINSFLELQEQTTQQKTEESFIEPNFDETLDELIDEKGLINTNQTGVVDNHEDCFWLDPEGIIASHIEDFDGDDSEEMLVVYTEKDDDEDAYYIYFDMYEIENDKIQLADTMAFTSYHKDFDSEYNFLDVYLKEFQTSEVFAKASLVHDDNYYILCESRVCESVLGNGSAQNIWFVEYKNNEFQYESAFSQNAGGSCDFEYTSYLFDDGELVSSTLCYSEVYNYYGEGEQPNYERFGEAVEHYLSPFSLDAEEDVKYAIDAFDDNIDFFDSFVEDETEEIFTITNEIEDFSYEDSNSFPIVNYEFEVEN